MNRRQFVQAAVSSLLMPGAVLAVSAGTLGRDAPACDCFFFDERFPLARKLAEDLSGNIQPTPVLGDITGIWTGGLGEASSKAPMTMRGVTTESFYFCLKIMLGEHARVEALASRLDRNLFLWTIRTDNPLSTDTQS